MNSSQTDRSSTYLEQFIESVYFLPTELSRMLNTIKSLDERCCDLFDGLTETKNQLVAMPPAHQQHPPSDEYFKLMNKFEADQKTLKQFSEEKVLLAQQAYDLMEMHAMELDRIMENFEADMRIGGVQLDVSQLNLAIENMNDTIASASAVLKDHLGQAVRPEDWNVPLPADIVSSVPLPTTPLGPSAIQSAASAGPSRRPGSTTSGPSNRRRTPPVGAEDASFNAVQQLPIGALPSDGLLGQANGAQGAGFHPPAGLQPKSQRVQVPDRTLTVEDFTPALRGRHAELYWPDDKSWYLIQIQDVDPSTRKAHIAYTSGEVEVLDYEEIAREGHMNLIPAQFSAG